MELWNIVILESLKDRFLQSATTLCYSTVRYDNSSKSSLHTDHTVTLMCFIVRPDRDVCVPVQTMNLAVHS